MEFVSKWHPNRMGMVDFWYYTNEEFHFDHGHMLLRGSNGSGKSVTMQSFIPLLLDGNKSSERLDPFGTRSRKIENYLLEEEGGRDDRIGYLYLEFKREESDTYKTIGMGLHARKGKPLDTWYFVIEDNRRIGVDIQLMQNNLAISRQSLKNLIQEQLYTSQKVYCEKVNQALFGFERIEEYKEAIDLLLQLRSPKLSNSLKPSMLNEILNNSLRPLSEEDLRPMSEAISNMDNIKDQLDALKQSRQSANAIYQVYEQYGKALLYEKLHLYQNAYKEEEMQKKKQDSFYREQEENKKIKEECLEKQKDYQRKIELLKKEEEDLNASDRLRLVKEVQGLEKEYAQLKEELQRKLQALDKKETQYHETKKDYKKQKDEYEVLCMQIDEKLKEMDDLQEELQLEEHDAFRLEFQEETTKDYDFTYTLRFVKEKEENLRQVILKLKEYTSQKEVLEQLIDSCQQREDEVQKQRSLVSKYESLYDEMLDEYREGMNSWYASLKQLHIEKSALEDMQKFLSEYEERKTFLPIQNIIQQAFHIDKEQLSTTRIQLENEQRLVQKELLRLHQEIEEWENKEDPMPFIEDGRKQNRAFLDKQGISYRPLYTLLEFDEQVNEELKGQIEEYLQRSRLLNALLVHKDQKETILKKEIGSFDDYVFTDKEVEYLSSWYLKGNTLQELYQSLFAFFEELHISVNGLSFDEDGYQMHAIYGTLAKDKQVVFVGKKAREQYRKDKIEELKALKEEQQKEETRLKDKIADILGKEEILKEESASFLTEDDLQKALLMWKEEEGRLSLLERSLNEAKKRVEEKQAMLQKLYLDVQKMASSFPVKLQVEAFEEYRSSFEDYKQYLQDICTMYPSSRKALEMKLYLSVKLNELEEDIDTVKYEKDQLDEQSILKQQLLVQKQQQLKELGGDDITKRLQEISDLLIRLPKEQLQNERKLGSLEEAEIKINEELRHLEVDLQEKEQTTALYLDILKEQVDNGCIRIPLEEYDDLVATVMLYEKQNPIQKKSDTLKGDVQGVFYAQRGSLQDYQVSFTMDDLWEEVDGISSRIHLKAKFHGKQLPFEQLLEQLDTAIETQKHLLEDSDRHLFEDILVNIISKKIRIRIQDSKHWVETMNRYMNAMTDSSSGLRLSLQWRNKKAESEEELDTKELVELLQKDVGMLKESDLKKLSTHFRSRIESVRRVMDEEDNMQSFHQLMRVVMDYRQWFEFRILAQKAKDTKKELTNQLFFSFSGGEKAMAMYVPLFSAVAAKFESSRKDAPLLIALDEAFAGVDDKNISIMFALIEKFNFDYIMNSQVLWGDYPTVHHLAIYELFRPDNARFVTVIPYEWDGKVKRMKME